MQDLNVALVQCPLHWENRDANLQAFAERLSALKSTPDLVVLPEMFSTSFSMNGGKCAEEDGGPAHEWLQKKAAGMQCVIACSLMVREKGKLFNRFVWMRPDGTYAKYDKRHLFRFAGEHEHFSPGNELINIELKGWKFRPMVCYDLRFPVWSMNSYSDHTFGYDCLIYVANWPEKRRHHWNTLLQARAMENLSFCIGVNRTGTDGNGIAYSGDSVAIDPTGVLLGQCSPGAEETLVVTLKHEALQAWRSRFNAGQDWDSFTIL